MKNILVVSAGVMFALALAGCAPEKWTADVVRYLGSEPDAGTQLTRMLATRTHLRIDDGRDDGDFVLFNRNARTIYSVTHASRNVTVVGEAKVTVAPPARFATRSEEQPMPDSPRVGNQPPALYRFFVNGVLCAEVAAAPLLPDMVQALREYHSVLATQQAALYRDAPESITNDCDLANYVLSSQETLRHGLPLRQRLADGRVRELTDYASGVEISRALFSVPPDYAVFRMGPDSEQSP